MKELVVTDGLITHVVVINTSKEDMVVFSWDRNVSSMPNADFWKLKSQVLKHFIEVLKPNQKGWILRKLTLDDIANIDASQCVIYVKTMENGGLWDGNKGKSNAGNTDVPRPQNAGNA